MAVIPHNSTGLSGEYFVAAELYRRGWSVGMTAGNAKAIDLFAEKGEKRIAVQVKSIYKRKNVGWPIMLDKVKEDCFYIFVNLNADLMISPDYYIATSLETKSKVKQYTTRGIIDLSTLNNTHFKNNWNKLEVNESNEDLLESVKSETTVHKYEGVWKKLLPQLTKAINSSVSTQISLNAEDFRLVGNRKSYSFNLEILNGESANNISGSAVARDLYSVLKSENNLLSCRKNKLIKIGLGKDFILKIR